MRTSWLLFCATLFAWPGVVLAHDVHEAVFHAFRLELAGGENRDHEPVASWDLDGWLGGNDNKLWLKSEGEVTDHHTESSETWLLYSRNISPFWDAQLGMRYDNRPTSVSYGVLGVRGLAPFHWETEVHLFASEEGDFGMRVHEEKDFLFTQQLILQPTVELNLYAQDIRETAVGSGLSDASVSLQLRYEITRRLAPYIELGYTRMYGDTADLAIRRGEDRSDSTLTAGVRLLF